MRVESLCALLVFLVACLVFSLRESLTVGMASLAITYIMNILDATSWTVRTASNVGQRECGAGENMGV